MKRWIELVKLVVPVVLSVVNPALAPLATIIIHGITEAEALGAAQTGAAKRAHVLGIVEAGVAGTNLTAGRAVIDPIQAEATAGTVIDATVAVTNLVHRIPRVEP